MWTKILEQILLVMLVIGRWLLPKGDLTREQLSQLLLVYTGMAADIVELFEAFKEDAVLENLDLTYAVLGIWSWSLLQFTLVLTATHGRKPRLGMDSAPSIIHQESQESLESHLEENSVDMGIIAIVTSVVLQDGPFLLLRLVLIFRYNVVSYLNIFFTCKNSLVACLQLYRLSVLCIRRRPFHVCTSANEDRDEESSEGSTNEESAQEESHTESKESQKNQPKGGGQVQDPEEDDDLWREFQEWKRSQIRRRIPMDKSSSPRILVNLKNLENPNPENPVDLNELFLRTAILAQERRIPDYLKYIDPGTSKVAKNHSDSDISEYDSHEFYPFEDPRADWNSKSVDSIVQDRPGSSVSQQIHRSSYGVASTPTVQRRWRKAQPTKKPAQDCESTPKNPRNPAKNLSCPPSSNDSGNSSTSVPDLRRALANNFLRRNYCASECFTDPCPQAGSRRKSKRILTSEDEEEKLRSESYV